MTGRDNRLWIALEAAGIHQVLARSEAAAVYMADGYARLKGTTHVRVRPIRAGGRQRRGRARRAVLGRQSGRRPRVGDAPFGSLPPRVPGARAAAAVRLGDEMGRRGVGRRPTCLGCVREAARHAIDRRPGPRLSRHPERHLRGGAPGLHRPGAARPGLRGAVLPAGAERSRRRGGRARRSPRPSRPIILAGGGIHQSGAHEALRQFAERLAIPVATSNSGKGSIAETHDLALGSTGRYSRNYANAALRDADVILAVGTALGGMVTDSYKLDDARARASSTSRSTPMSSA